MILAVPNSEREERKKSHERVRGRTGSILPPFAALHSFAITNMEVLMPCTVLVCRSATHLSQKDKREVHIMADGVKSGT